MDKELLDLLNNARASGANESQMQGIVDSYNQKKKNLSNIGGGNQTDVLEKPLSNLQVDANGQLQKSVPTTSKSQSPVSTETTTVFDVFPKTPTVTTNDGVQFPVTQVVTKDFISTQNKPEDIQALQQRISSNTTTDQDIQALAQSSGKSVDATKAYLTKGKDLGSALDVTENLSKTNQQVTNGFNALKQSLGVVGSQFNSDDILSSADKSSLFLQQINTLQQADARHKNITENVPTPFVQQEVFAPSINPELSQQVNDTKEALVYNIRKLTADEADKKGLTSEQAGELLYKRIAPTGYAKNKAMRESQFTNAATKISSSTLGNPIQQLNGFIDWASNKAQLNFETLNVEKGQYEIEANKGLQHLAIEKKAQGIINNDQALLDQAENISSKVQDEDKIIEKYPLYMKQTMADYVNKRFAQEAGIMEGTQSVDANGQLLSITGLNRDVTKRYLKEGGFYDKANYKDYADEVVNNPATYLADNSWLGGAGIAFLKPFKSIFNTAADLTGVRTSTDRHLERVRDEMFPERLTQDVKKGSEFSIGGNDYSTGFKVFGHEFNMNVSNTINSVANLGGYIAATTATAGVAAGLGTSATTAQRLGAWASFGMDAVDSGLKEADKMGLNPAQAWIYAGMKGAMMAEGGRLLDFGKIPIPSIKGVNEDLAKAAIGISDKTLTEDAAKELLNGTSNAWVEGLKKYGIGVAKGAAVMTGFSIGGNLLKVGFGDTNANPEQILPEAANAFFNGLFTMGVIGITGIKGNIENAKNSTYKGMLNKVIDNYDASQDILKIGLEKNLYTQDEYNQKLQILNTGIKAKTTFNQITSEQGINFTPEQRSVWIANTTVEKMLRNAAEKEGVTEKKANEYIQQADNLVEQNTKILDGLDFNSFLEPKNDIYNAGVDLKQAQTDFAENPTSENEKIVLEKKTQLEKTQNTGTKLSEPIQGLDEQGVPIKDITVGEMINQVGTYKGEKGNFFQDGQTVVFKVEGKNKEYELGNIDEIKDTSIADFGIEHETSVVGIDESGNIKVRDESYVNNFSDPLAAINRDANGNVVSVNLETAEGKKRTFRGNIAEDVAYQINLKEITKDNETRTNFENFINEDATAQAEINNATIPAATEKIADTGNAEVPRETIEPKYTVDGFADRIASGEKLTTPEDLQYYENNKTEIENLLKQKQQNEPTTGTVNEPIPTNEGQPAEQGTEATVQPGATTVNEPSTETGTAISEPKIESKNVGGDNKPPTDNIDETDVGDEGVGVSHAETENVRKKFGLGDYQRGNATDAELEALADAAIKKGYNPETLIRQMESGTPPTGVENFILKKYLATLESKFDKNPTDENLAPIERLVKATDKIGSLQSEAFRTRKGVVPVEDSLAGFFIAEKEVNQDAPLTEKQKEVVEKEYKDISEKEKKYEETISKLEAENARLKAEKKVAKEKKSGTTKRTHEDYVKDRDSIIKSAKDKIQAARDKANSPDAPKQSGLGGRTYLDDLTLIAPDVLKLVKSYVDEGVTNLGEIIRNIHPTLKEDIPEITEKDVHDIIAGEYNKKAPTKSEAAKNLFEVKQQAQLINRLQRLLDGTEPKDEKAKIKRNQEIDGLQKQIKDFKKENPDKQAQLKSLKTKNENELKKVQEQLKTGKFEVPIKKTPFIYDSQLKKDFPELYRQAVETQNALIKAKQERQIRLAVQQYENRSKYEKLKDQAVRYLNVPRTLMASMDYSAPLRQAVIVSIVHPKTALIAGSEMFKASFSQKRFDRWSFDLKETPRYKLMQDSGLSLTDPHSLHLQVQEEAFMGNIAEKIPVVGGLIKGSERAYVSYLNKMRADLFNRYADIFEEQGKTFENSPKLYKGLANYVNNATGRGNLGFAETAAPILNTVLFSPRLIASRFNMLGLGDIATLGNGFYGKLPKEVRVLAMKDMLKFVAAGVGVLAVAAAAGSKVETDPRSSDFGKIKSGDTRWDIWGGFQPYVRVLAQVIAGERKSTNTGKIIDISSDKAKFGANRADLLVSFGRGKLAPIPSMVWDILSGRTVQGNKVLMQFGGKTKGNEITLKDEAIQHFVPLIYSDVSQALKDKDISSLFTVGVPSVFGVGVQTYSNTKKK